MDAGDEAVLARIIVRRHHPFEMGAERIRIEVGQELTGAHAAEADAFFDPRCGEIADLPRRHALLRSTGTEKGRPSPSRAKSYLLSGFSENFATICCCRSIS